MGFVKTLGLNAKRGSEGYGIGLVRSTSFGRKRVALSDVCTRFEDDDEDDCIREGYGIGLVRSTSFGRKRVALSDICIRFENDDEDDCIPVTPLKRQCSRDSLFFAQKSALEDLPQEILIRILCGVEHDDLKRLFFVSKAIRQATLIAKQSHFAYSTPQKTVAFREVDDFGDFNDAKAPNAPKRWRVPPTRLSAKKLSDISVALFASDDEKDVWPNRNLIIEMETGV